MEFLQGGDFIFLGEFHVFDPFCRRFGCRHSGDIGGPGLDCRFPDQAVIDSLRLAGRGVDDQGSLPVCDKVHDIRPSCTDLGDFRRRNAHVPDRIAGAFCSDDVESALVECLCHFFQFVLIPVIDGDQHGPF